MSILYLLTSPPPVIEGTDAVFQEVATLQRFFGGETLNLFPLKKPSTSLPRPFYGLHKIRELSVAEQRCRLNHIYHPILYLFPVLRFLRNPVVYTVAASLRGYTKPSNVARLQCLHRIVVSNERDADVLASWGLRNYSIVLPGIDTPVPPCRFLPLGQELTLLMASAPWEPRQFELKGIDTLLEAAATLPFLKLLLLWRGLLFDDLVARVKRLGIENRVEIINQRVNVNDYLERAHASVLLATRGDVVKAYPHSLLESLLAGRPVLISESIPMADYVHKYQAGVVVGKVNSASLIAAIETLKSNYAALARNAERIGRSSFSVQALVENHRRVYGEYAANGDP